MTEKRKLPRLLVAAPFSGSGKTTVVCGLLRAAQRRGLSPCAFKCGPDYIDPMFHREVLGLPSRNLDLFFASQEAAREQLAAAAAKGRSLAVLEGVMGLYDGVGNTDRASSWHLARATDTPVLLVLRPQGAALTLAALVRGLRDFRTPSQIGGVLLNGCSERLASRLGPALERETGLPVFGFLPHMPECAIPSRHLGLFTPGEVADLSAKVDRAADQLERTADLEGIFALARSASPLEERLPPACAQEEDTVVAVAWDRAFCFYYQDNLDALRRAGARLVFFRPTEDTRLPEGTCGLYLGGGYPELHARALSQNAPMGQAVRRAIEGGMPTLAECGGFLYLQKTLEDPEGTVWPMTGVLEGAGVKTGRLQRFGYVTLTAREDCPYWKRGETMAAHEFHRWDCAPGGSFCHGERPAGGEGWDCIVRKGNLLAGFPHLYFPSNPQFAPRFVAACRRYCEEVLP